MTLYAINVRRTHTTEEMAVVHIEATCKDLAVAQVDFMPTHEFDWMPFGEPLVSAPRVHAIYVDGKQLPGAANDDA